jgi:hypothetical protein
MSTRTSVELQAGLCRIVEVDADARNSVRARAEAARTHAPDVRVRRFFTELDVAIEFSPTLHRLRQHHRLARRAVVTLWGLRSTHHRVRVPAAVLADAATCAADEVKEEIALIEADGSRARLAATVRDVPVGDRVERDVSLTAASEQEIERRIEPIARAGFVVTHVVTPAMALASVARGRGDAGAPSIYVALAARATCVAVVKDGALLMARELPWGHGGSLHPDHAEGDEPFERRLASELRRSTMCFRQSFRTNIESIVLCGDMIGLRRLTRSLGTALDVSVQTLDSLTGIDAESVPEPASVFRADVAALRLAIAVGAEREPHASLVSSAAGRRSRYPWRAPVAAFPTMAAAAAAVLILIAGYIATRPSRPPSVPMLKAAPLDVRVVSVAPTELQVRRSVAIERGSDIEPGILVESILFSPDRRLAVVNGRITRAGDRVGDAVIVDIQPRAVIVELRGGRRRTIGMRTPLTSGDQ